MEISITQILREINFEHSRSAETAVFDSLRGSEFCSFGKFQPSKSTKNHKGQNSGALNLFKWQIFHFSKAQN